MLIEEFETEIENLSQNYDIPAKFYVNGVYICTSVDSGFPDFEQLNIRMATVLFLIFSSIYKHSN